MTLERAAVLALGLVSASSFEIVSQTFNGNLTMTYSIPGVPAPTIATVELGLDMEEARLRQNELIVVETRTPSLNMTITKKVSMIFDASTQRGTMYTETDIKSSTPIPSTPATCQYYEFPNMPNPKAVAKCMQDVAALAKPVAPDDDAAAKCSHDLFAFAMHMPFPKAKGAADEVICTSKAFVMKKLIADISVFGAHPMTIHSELIDMDSIAGAPKKGTFVVPTEWGTCVPTPIPPIPTTNNPVMKSFLHCVGISRHECTIAKTLPEDERTDCGHSGFTQAMCEQRGCCWKPTADATNPKSYPWCFFSGAPGMASQASVMV